jgi:hypothetical protein
MQWIFSRHLDQWAGTQVGRAEIARLVGSLICATAKTIRSFRFPAGDSSQNPGFDGHLIAEGAPPFVPDGESVWEFGAGANYLAKANEEYEKRTAAPGSVDSSKCSFVFVTPREWKRDDPTLVDWQIEKSAMRRWRSVIAIDANALEEWLSRAEAVAKNYAQAVRGQLWVNGCRSVNEYWDEYSKAFKRALTEDVVLCERKLASDELVKRMMDTAPGPIRLQSDSSDEIVAFVMAAIRTADPEVRNFLEARTLVIDTAEAAREHLGKQGLIFVPRDGAMDVAGQLSYSSPAIIALTRDEKGTPALPRASTGGFARAMLGMGFDEQQAERLSRESARSVTILARRIPSGFAPRPPWAVDRKLIPALLAGAWDAFEPGDKKIIGDLAGLAYDDYEEALREFLGAPEPFEREGSIWKVRAPVEAFSRLAPLITKRDVDRLRDAATTVFSEVDPALDLPPEERSYGSLMGQKGNYSRWLRDGLASTLLHFTFLHDGVGLDVAGLSPEQFATDLVANLPGLRDDARVMASLERQLVWLMEAAPRPLLSALERLLEGERPAILLLFEEDATLFPHSSHTNLLWALESLAWSPAFLPQVSIDLARLASIDPGGRLANRPITSLVSIFKAWMPQTSASLPQRLSAIDQVVAKVPHIGWKLVSGLLPTRMDSGAPTARPRFRDLGTAGNHAPTVGIVHETYGEVIARALALAKGDIERLMGLVEAMGTFRRNEMESVCDELQTALGGLPGDRRLSLWIRLRKTVSMHRAHKEADWAMPSVILDRLEATARQIEPNEPITKVKWLFDDHYPPLDNVPVKDLPTAVDEARKDALQRILQEMGRAGVARLAKEAAFPGMVGAQFANVPTDAEGINQMMIVARSAGGISEEFFSALSSVAHDRFGSSWCDQIRAYASGGYSGDELATLLLAWNGEQEAWKLAQELGAEVVRRFWLRRPAWPVRGDLGDLETVAREYLAVGRSLTGLACLWDDTDRLPVNLVFALLDASLAELSASTLNSNLAYEIEIVFDKLAARTDVDSSELARREYAYLWLLKHRRRTLTLHSIMATDPRLFVSVLCDVFRPASGNESEPSEETKTRARYGFELLSGFKQVPGFGEGADASALESWVREVRQIASEKDRSQIADQFVGQTLAYAPNDPDDDAWPHIIVRELLQKLESDEIESGMRTARFNQPGAHAIDPQNPAALERGLAAQARKWAETAVRWPRTVAMLNSMADHWDWMADALERQRRQDAMRE